MAYGQSSAAVFTQSGSNTVNSYITNNTTGISIAIAYDADKSAGADVTSVRAQWTSGSNPSAINDGNYTRALNLSWPSQNGNPAGSGSFYGENRANGTQHTVNIAWSQLENAIGSSTTSGRLYIALRHGTTYDNDSFSGAGIQSGGSSHFYFHVDRAGPVLTNIKLFKDPSQGTEQTATSNLYINSYKIKYTVGAEAIDFGFLKYECVSGGCSTTNTGSGGSKTIGSYTFKDAWNNQESANTTYTYATDPTLTHGAVYNISLGVMDERNNYAIYGPYNNVMFLSDASDKKNTVTNVTASATEADLALNETVNVLVTFNNTHNSGKVFVSGNPTFSLTETDPSWTEAENYVSGSGTNQLTFTYTVDSDHYSTNLRYTDKDNDFTAGTYIRDQAGNNVSLVLPAPGGAGSFDANTNITVDGIVPAAFSVQSLVATGGLVKAGKWNSTNTGISAGVQINDDNSLVDGTVQLKGESTGTFRDLGAAFNIPTKSTTQTLTASAEGTGDIDVEELEGNPGTPPLTEGQVISMKATVTDKMGNSTLGSAASTTLAIDQTVPTVSDVDGEAGNYKLGESFDITVTYSEAMEISGTPQLILGTDNAPGTNTATVDMASFNNDKVLTFNYTVGSTHYSLDLDYKATSSLSAGTYSRDVAWNPANTDLANPGATKSLADGVVITVDGVAPDVFDTGAVLTTASSAISVVAGYINEDNVNIVVTVPIANDASLENGKAQIQAKIDGNNFVNVGTAGTIAGGNLGGTLDVTVPITGTLDQIAGYALGKEIIITARLEDYAKRGSATGNLTTGNQSDTKLIIDEDDPAAFDLGTVTTVTEKVVDGKWNGHNTAVNIVVPIATENSGPTLLNGKVQILGKVGGAYETVGDPVTIDATAVGANTLTATITKAQLEAIAGSANDGSVDEGDVITISARITDRAGNPTDASASSVKTLTVDRVVPTVTEVTSDATDGTDNPKKVGDNVDIKVTFDSDVLIDTGGGTPVLQLKTDESPGSVNSEATYISGSNSKFPLFRLTVATDNYSSNLNYRATSSLVLNNGTIRDLSGNSANTDLPGLTENEALKQKKELWIDGVAPTLLEVGAVITKVDSIVASHWNAKNTGLNITVPLEKADISLKGGKIQVQAQAIGNGATGTWTNIGKNETIAVASVDDDGEQVVQVVDKDTSDPDFEEINKFSDQNPNDVVSIRALVSDKAGNSTTYSISKTTITIDQIYPSTPATFKPSRVRSSLTFGGADDATYGQYWNQSHQGVNITIPFSTDPTLEGGYLQFQARAGTGGNWVPVGFRKVITPAQVASGADLTYSFDTVTSIEERIQPKGLANVGNDNEQEFGIDKIAGFDNDKVIYFRVMVADAAGNSIYSDISDETLYVEERSPTINEVTSSNDNKAYKSGDKINVQVVSTAVYAADPNMTVTGTPQLKLETGDVADAVVNYTSGSGTKTLLFEYTIATGHSSPDLNYFDVNSLELNAGTIKDPYGNAVSLTLPALDNANALKQKKDIEIDTTPPSITFTYDDPDSLVRFEDGQMVITATFTDSIEFNTVPILTVDFPNNTDGDKTNVNMTSKTGKIFTYNLPLVDNSDGQIAVSITAKDKALNPLIADSVFADSIITIDNTDPIAFRTGLMTMFGDTVSGSWFNKSTDSLRVIVPVDITDESLLRGNIQIQMQVDGKMTSDTWATILPKDSLEVLAASISKYRTKKEVLDILTPQKLAQGDSVFVRAMINDQVGNTTIGATSASFFILDTIPPALIAGQKGLITLTDRPDTTISNLNGEKIFLTSLRNGNNNDTLWTNDSLVFATQNWEDPKLEAEVYKSGIQRYEYSLFESTTSDSASAFTTFRSYKFQTNLLDTVIIAIDSLTHNRWYYPRLRAVDVAGNTSAPISYYKTFRHNARPSVDTIPRVIAYEDVLWEKVLEINDKDVATLNSDKFFYDLESFISDTTQTPWAIIEPEINTINAAVSVAGNVSFTPTKLDTAAYIHRVIITDNWGLKDTLDIEMRVNPVNDPPVLDLSAISKLIFNEGTSSDSINLTRYVTDEDNLVSSLKYSFKIASKLPANIGYPTAKIGFLSNFSKVYKNKLITDLVDEYPSSTIIQKNNSLIIYPGSISNFKDPIKVDSLSQNGGTIDSLYAWITQTDSTSADTNYYTEYDMLVEYTAIDPEGLEGKDTVLFFIDALNDPPVWAGLNDTIVKENDELYIDFANYLTDVDDSTLTLTILPLTYDSEVTVEPSKAFEKKAEGYVYSSKAKKDVVKIKPDELWFKADTGPWRDASITKNPLDTLTNQIKFKITAADDDTSAIDTFIVKVQRVPRPEIRMYVVQNNAFTNYYEVFLVDSVGKTRDLELKVQSKTVTLDTAAAYTYVGHYNFQTEGKYTFEVNAKGIVGDTITGESISLTFAKMYGNWAGASADGQFHVIGTNRSVNFDQSIMILDSTLFEPHFNDRASYLLGNEALKFNKLVEVSMPGYEEVAIYRRSLGTGWIELPSYTEGRRVNAYTDKMGYFRIGPKTLTVPGQTSLQQNYPNPFNPSTTIDYDLGFVDGPYQRVNVTIYDIMGRNIKVLVNDEKSIGRYNVRWNGKDQNEVQVASGVYFVHLTTDMGRSQTKKIMLMR